MRILGKIFPSLKRKEPEDQYQVTITSTSVMVEHPKNIVEEIVWNDIEEIKLLNTDTGPFAPDIWLVLSGKDSQCSIPHGNIGFDKVYEVISKYENFNFENFTNSMASTENEIFLLWRRTNYVA